MPLPLVGVQERLRRLLASIVASAEAEVCEGSRLLLAECLLTAAFHPEAWNEELIRRVESVFCLSVASTTGHYRQNVVDRWSDFLTLKRAGVFRSTRDPGGETGDPLVPCDCPEPSTRVLARVTPRS